jgi:hypothetical protein
MTVPDRQILCTSSAPLAVVKVKRFTSRARRTLRVGPLTAMPPTRPGHVQFTNRPERPPAAAGSQSDHSALAASRRAVDQNIATFDTRSCDPRHPRWQPLGDGPVCRRVGSSPWFAQRAEGRLRCALNGSQTQANRANRPLEGCDTCERRTGGLPSRLRQTAV